MTDLRTLLNQQDFTDADLRLLDECIEQARGAERMLMRTTFGKSREVIRRRLADLDALWRKMPIQRGDVIEFRLGSPDPDSWEDDRPTLTGEVIDNVNYPLGRQFVVWDGETKRVVKDDNHPRRLRRA